MHTVLNFLFLLLLAQPSGVYITEPQVVKVSKIPATVLPATSVGDAKVWCVYLTNAGKHPMTGLKYQYGVDGTHWDEHIWTSCDALEPGQTCSFCTYPKAEQYVRVVGVSSLGTSLRVVFAKRTWEYCRGQ